MTIGKHNTRGPAEKAEQRKVIWEMYEQGVPVTEIAKRLKCSASSVSANLRRQKEKRIRIQSYNQLTMRDHFAMAALNRLIPIVPLGATISDIADEAYAYADAMMEAREK